MGRFVAASIVLDVANRVDTRLWNFRNIQLILTWFLTWKIHLENFEKASIQRLLKTTRNDHIKERSKTSLRFFLSLIVYNNIRHSTSWSLIVCLLLTVALGCAERWEHHWDRAEPLRFQFKFSFMLALTVGPRALFYDKNHFLEIFF